MARKKDVLDDLNDEDTLEFVHELKKDLNNKFDYQIAYEMGDEGDLSKVTEYVSSGVSLLDYCVANKKGGGFPVGRITELHGESGSGKSLVALLALANTQKRGGIAVLIDTERSHNEEFAQVLGLRKDKGFIHAKPDTVEDVLTLIENIVTKVRAKASDKLITIVWDSIAATPVAEELAKDWDPKSSRSPLAGMMNLAMKKLLRQIESYKICLIFLNQIRENQDTRTSMIDPWRRPGGKALIHSYSCSVRLKQAGKLKDKDDKIVGIKCEAEVFKSRLGASRQKLDFNIRFDSGVDDVDSIKEYLKEVKAIRQGGAWSYIPIPGKEEIRFQGKEQFEDLLNNNQDVKDYVYAKLDENLILKYKNSATEFVL